MNLCYGTILQTASNGRRDLILLRLNLPQPLGPVDEEQTVQMVDPVLEDPRRPAAGLNFEGLSVRSNGFTETRQNCSTSPR